MNPTHEACLSKPRLYPRRGTRVPATRRPRSSGLTLSVVLHAIVLGGFVHFANLAPSPVPFDVFAADPVDAAPEHAVAHSPSAPPRPRPMTTPPRGRSSPTGRPRPSSATVPAPALPVPASDS